MKVLLRFDSSIRTQRATRYCICSWSSSTRKVGAARNRGFATGLCDIPCQISALLAQSLHTVIQAAIDKGFGETDYSAIYEGVNP